MLLNNASKIKYPIAIRLTYCSTAAGCVFSHAKIGPSIETAINNAVSIALVIHEMAQQYQVPLILETETRCLDKMTNWYEGLLEASASYGQKQCDNRPLFSSHYMEVRDWVQTDSLDVYLDLVEQYLFRLTECGNCTSLNIKLPVFTERNEQEEIRRSCERLSRISSNFMIVVDPSGLKTFGRYNDMATLNQFVVLRCNIGGAMSLDVERALAYAKGQKDVVLELYVHASLKKLPMETVMRLFGSTDPVESQSQSYERRLRPQRPNANQIQQQRWPILLEAAGVLCLTYLFSTNSFSVSR
jgi:hypothetical protein